VRQVEAIMVANGAPDDMAIWCMMETPKGMLRAEEIALASPRMGGFVMGTSDLAKDLHCAHTAMRLPMITSLGLCLLAARAYGLAALDGVYLDLGDDEGFEYPAARVWNWASTARPDPPKTIGRPPRLRPSEKDIAWSTIIAAHPSRRPERRGGGDGSDRELPWRMRAASWDRPHRHSKPTSRAERPAGASRDTRSASDSV
jgi:citrate lyase subunit beta/citryl-CoA lyase